MNIYFINNWLGMLSRKVKRNIHWCTVESINVIKFIDLNEDNYRFTFKVNIIVHYEWSER